MITLRLGDEGDGVLDVRNRLEMLALTISDVPRPELFDSSLDQAVRAFQQSRGLTPDGVIGPSTYRALEDATWTLGDRVLVHVAGAILQGDDVIALQQKLLDLGFASGRIDGRFGPQTERALKEFQRNVGLVPDGTCGPATLKALDRLAPRATGGNPNAFRAEERLRIEGPQLAGKIIVLDAGGDDITADITRRIEGRLVATGVQAFLTHESFSAAPTELVAADFANRVGAHLVIAVRADDTEASDVATYFYGIEAHGVVSSVGERFAGLVQREIVARTGLSDAGMHQRSWDLLRHTRMPAVVIGISNSQRVARVRDLLAESIVAAVQRLYLAPEDDELTGVLDLSALRVSRRP